MSATPTRCGFCGRTAITRAGRCPACGRPKSEPPARVPEPPPPSSVWRGVGSQVVPVAAALALIAGALLIGSQILLYIGILALCAIGVLYVVAHSDN